MGAVQQIHDPAHDISPEELLGLARSRAPDDRERLLMGVVALCETAPEVTGGQSHDLLSDVFLTLVAQAERDIRKALAERLSEADWAPRALVNMLA
ncbi:MAG TPA: hypothetical protein VGB49_09665, partial [Caulobacteraceae bacterium]